MITKNKTYQKRWIIYCKELNIPLNSKNCNLHYINWIQEKWRQFIEETGLTKLNNREFDEWLSGINKIEEIIKFLNEFSNFNFSNIVEKFNYQIALKQFCELKRKSRKLLEKLK